MSSKLAAYTSYWFDRNMFYSKRIEKISKYYRITNRDLVNLIILTGEIKEKK